jgi:hypothetical protein
VTFPLAIYNWAAVEILGHLTTIKLLKLSDQSSLDIIQTSDKALIPPRLNRVIVPTATARANFEHFDCP